MNVTRSHFCPTLSKTCSSKVNVPVPLSSSHCSGGVCDGHHQESCAEEPARAEGSQLERGARWSDWPKRRRVRKLCPSSGPCGQVGSERPHIPNCGRGGSHPGAGWSVESKCCGLGCSRGPAPLQNWVGSDRQGLPGWVLHVLGFQERAAGGLWACWVNLKSAGMSTTAV